MFFLVLAGFVMLMLVFTFFELVGDILRNHIPLTTVGDYLAQPDAEHALHIAPLAVLIAVLVTFGVLNRNSEIVAMKAPGSASIALWFPSCPSPRFWLFACFSSTSTTSPRPIAGRRRCAAPSRAGRRRPSFIRKQKWIFGQPHPGEPGRIFYYQFFDPDNDEFANLSVFEFDPSTFALSRRIFASRVYWDPRSRIVALRRMAGFANFEGANSEYTEFKSTSFAEIHEDPGYFKKENLQSQEMNFGQLDRYIRDLRQSGFDTMRLRVAALAQARLPAHRHRHGGAGNSLCALHGTPRIAHRHRRGHRRGPRVLGRRWPVWRHGERELSAGRLGRLVSGRPVRPDRWLSAAANAHLMR